MGHLKTKKCRNFFHLFFSVVQQQLRPTSPHVRFTDPPVTSDKKHSPPVSPIPFRNTAVTSSRALPDKRVVVNLPNVWSDVSSTFSF